MVAENELIPEGQGRLSIPFPPDFLERLDSVGNSDDYLSARKTLNFFVDGVDVTSQTQGRMERDVSYIYTGNHIVTNALFDHFGFVLNQYTFDNAFGTHEEGFYARTFSPDEIMAELPETRIRLFFPLISSAPERIEKQRVSVLYYQQGEHKVPLCVGQNENENNALYITWLDGSKSLDSQSRDNMGAAIIKFCDQGLPTLSEITVANVPVPNPIGPNGERNNTVRFYESDPKTRELYDLTLDLIVMYRKTIAEKNQNLNIISKIDQKANELANAYAALGIDITQFHPPKDKDFYLPFNQLTNVSYNVVTQLFVATRTDRSLEEIAGGVSGDVEDSVVHKAKFRLSKKEIEAMVLHTTLRVCQDLLGVSDEEMEERMGKI